MTLTALSWNYINLEIEGFIYMRSLFGGLREKVASDYVKIVFPEGSDERVLRAAARLKFEGLVDPVILGKADEVHDSLARLGFVDQDYSIIDPEQYEKFEEMKEAFVEIRKGKATMEDADRLLKDVNYFGVMLVKLVWQMVWYQGPFIQQLILYVLLFKLLKQNQEFHALQVYS